MNALEILFVLCVIAGFIGQYLHFNYRLRKQKFYSDNLEHNLESKVEAYIELEKEIAVLNNTIKEWKDASQLKQNSLDTLFLKLETLLKLIKYLKINWNKHLIILENNEFITPALRLTYKENEGYSVVAYQGSRDLSKNTNLVLPIVNGSFVSISIVIEDIVNTKDIVNSEKFKSIVKFLNQ